MKTICEILKGVSAYPIPLRTLAEIAELRELSLDVEATKDIMVGKAYKLAKADIIMWLSNAPNITQGGQSYSFTDEQRQQFRNQAKALYDDCGEATNPIYGYKGTRL